MGKGMPSAYGSEWKARDMKEARDNYNSNMEKIFGEKKPWYEVRDEKEKGSVHIEGV